MTKETAEPIAVWCAIACPVVNASGLLSAEPKPIMLVSTLLILASFAFFWWSEKLPIKAPDFVSDGELTGQDIQRPTIIVSARRERD